MDSWEEISSGVIRRRSSIKGVKLSYCTCTHSIFILSSFSHPRIDLSRCRWILCFRVGPKNVDWLQFVQNTKHRTQTHTNTYLYGDKLVRHKRNRESTQDYGHGVFQQEVGPLITKMMSFFIIFWSVHSEKIQSYVSKNRRKSFRDTQEEHAGRADRQAQDTPRIDIQASGHALDDSHHANARDTQQRNSTALNTQAHEQ